MKRQELRRNQKENHPATYISGHVRQIIGWHSRWQHPWPNLLTRKGVCVCACVPWIKIEATVKVAASWVMPPLLLVVVLLPGHRWLWAMASVRAAFMLLMVSLQTDWWMHDVSLSFVLQTTVEYYHHNQNHYHRKTKHFISFYAWTKMNIRIPSDVPVTTTKSIVGKSRSYFIFYRLLTSWYISFK